MRELGDAGEQLRLDVLAGHEHVDGLEAGSEPGLDEILALDDEQPEPRAAGSPTAAGGSACSRGFEAEVITPAASLRLRAPPWPSRRRP